MLLLLGTTVTTCFLDSLNPSTIAQQMILQSMMKTKRHICFFILGIGLTNLILGLAVYYGMAAWVAGWLSFITARYPVPVCSMMLIAGILCFVLGICRIRKIRSTKTSPGDESFKALDRLSPASLFLLSAAFCTVELTSALPYWGFLALLTSYHYPFPMVFFFILIYDLIYVLPLILLYLGYHRLQETKAIQKLEHILERVSTYIVPMAIVLVGAVLTYYGGMSLLG